MLYDPNNHNHLALILVHHHQINLHHNHNILTTVLIHQDQHIQELTVIPIISNYLNQHTLKPVLPFAEAIFFSKASFTVFVEEFQHSVVDGLD